MINQNIGYLFEKAINGQDIEEELKAIDVNEININLALDNLKIEGF